MSITKSFTALTVILVEEGKLSVNYPLSDFLDLNIGFQDSFLLVRYFLLQIKLN
jgi:CubicO group peptidase (beta-lactamase class C family)